jgi:hypothetical protein
MLNIKEREPYIILPKQRYNLSTYEPASSMQEDFTFFCDFKLNTEEMGSHYGICMRPGMHMGVSVKTDKDTSWIGFDFWYDKNGETIFDTVYFKINEGDKFSKNDRYFIFVQHDVVKRKFSMILNSETFVKPYYMEKFYDGKLVDYKEAPFNLGCGSYMAITPENDRYYCSVNFYKLGLIENISYTLNDILNFLDNTKDDTSILSHSLDNLVFYFNFNLKNIYKIWDLSGHCNFIQKNLYIQHENMYLTDADFSKDYEK